MDDGNSGLEIPGRKIHLAVIIENHGRPHPIDAGDMHARVTHILAWFSGTLSATELQAESQNFARVRCPYC